MENLTWRNAKSLNFILTQKTIDHEMSHKNFRAIYTNRDENFYGELHVAKKQ